MGWTFAHLVAPDGTRLEAPGLAEAVVGALAIMTWRARVGVAAPAFTLVAPSGARLTFVDLDRGSVQVRKACMHACMHAWHG